MWETCSEGSPISPVFKTPELLAKWLAENNGNAGAHRTATYNEWLAMIKVGWAPTLVSTDNKLMTGVEAVNYNKKGRKA